MKRAPTDLSKKSKIFWNTICREFQLETHHFVILTEICRIMDRLNEIRELITTDGIMLVNPSGLKRLNPLLKAEHECGNRLIGAWKSLDFHTDEIPAQISNYQRNFG